jgi:hypothetical protein
VTILVQRAGSSSYTTLATATTNSKGYWSMSSNVAGTFWRVRWQAPSGRVYNGPPIYAFAH